MLLKRARRFLFSLLKTWLLGLTPVSPDTTALNFKLWLKIVREFLRKRLFFKSHKIAATGYYDIEDPLPDVIKTRHFF